MLRIPGFRLLVLLTFTALGAAHLAAQAPGVPIYAEGRGATPEAAAKKKAAEFRKAGKLIATDTVLEQLKRRNCSLKLPSPETKHLAPRELWARARKSHMRVGWFFQEKRPNPEPGKSPKRWAMNLSGGYVLTADGAVATCYHVAAPIDDDDKRAYLVAVDDEENVYPVTEILAADPDTDTCILKVNADHLTPLPIATDVYPGDKVACFSEPMGKRGFYTEGVVNRFFKKPINPPKKGDPLPDNVPVWVEVANDWAMGSSGSAVVDAFGNVVGHVSEIAPVVDDQADLPQKKRSLFPGTLIIFHQAIAACQVKALIDNGRPNAGEEKEKLVEEADKGSKKPPAAAEKKPEAK